MLGWRVFGNYTVDYLLNKNVASGRYSAGLTNEIVQSCRARVGVRKTMHLDTFGQCHFGANPHERKATPTTTNDRFEMKGKCFVMNTM